MIKPGDTFKVGEICPESGIYKLKNCSCLDTGACTVADSQYTIPLVKGKKFPPCKKCGSGIVWELVQKA